MQPKRLNHGVGDKAMNMSTDAATIDERPLNEIDVSDAQLYREDSWEPLFRRLRRDAPVHFHEASANGPY